MYLDGFRGFGSNVLMINLYFETPKASAQVPGEVLCSILIPCLNEEQNVQGAIIAAIEGAEDANCIIEVIIIDDGSSDQTFTRAKEIIDKHPDWSIRLKRHEKNEGYALSFLDGAKLSKGRYCKIHCGDNVFPRETVSTLLKAIGEADIVVPYDYGMEGRSLLRKLLSRAYTILVNTASGFRLKYYNGCPILPTEKVLQCISPSSGFGFQADMLCRILETGATYAEREVRFIERRHGKSTAISVRNLAKVADVLLIIFMRRIRRLLNLSVASKNLDVKGP